jgi:hypothetical protein
VCVSYKEKLPCCKGLYFNTIIWGKLNKTCLDAQVVMSMLWKCVIKMCATSYKVSTALLRLTLFIVFENLIDNAGNVWSRVTWVYVFQMCKVYVYYYILFNILFTNCIQTTHDWDLAYALTVVPINMDNIKFPVPSGVNKWSNGIRGSSQWCGLPRMLHS